jgi:hypothetical protein
VGMEWRPKECSCHRPGIYTAGIILVWGGRRQTRLVRMAVRWGRHRGLVPFMQMQNSIVLWFGRSLLRFSSGAGIC